MTDPADMTALALLDAFQSGALSPVEATRAVLDRIEACEPVLAAMYALDPRGAMEAARASEHRWRTGEARGALDGVPVTIKELIATRGVPVPRGTRATELVPAVVDAPPAARLREAGAVILGKTTCPDYGMLSSGVSSFHKLSRNPWDVSKTPGGSSAGAGAAAAAGYGPLHVGTDIGGSIRLPAGWCGVFGLKPSYGRVPIDPPFIGRVAGPMTRTVADSALLMSVLSKPDGRDYTSLPHEKVDWLDLDAGLSGKRIGLMLQAGCGLAVDPEVAQAVTRAAALFEAHGAIVETAPSFFTNEMLEGLDRFWRSRAWAEISALPVMRQAMVLPFILEWARQAAEYNGQTVYAGFSQIFEIRQAACATALKFDFLLSPTAPLPAFDAALPCPTNDPARPFEHIAYTLPANMSEQPAASINCGYTQAGLPIGLQIVGRRFDDIGVLRMAKAFEVCRDAQHPWPKPAPG